MKAIITSVILLLPTTVMGQGVMIDPRDGESYRTGVILGEEWMLEDLRWNSILSFGLSDSDQLLYPDINARWYHMNELDSVCPIGWRLPTGKDWIFYISKETANAGAALNFTTGKENISLSGFSGTLDLFEHGNSLNIIGTGIYQGSEFIRAPESADYWLQDLVTKKELRSHNEASHHLDSVKYDAVKISHTHRAHIHLFNEFTQIHSHKHHLNPNDEKNLRRFMVRCIKEK